MKEPDNVCPAKLSNALALVAPVELSRSRMGNTAKDRMTEKHTRTILKGRFAAQATTLTTVRRAAFVVLQATLPLSLLVAAAAGPAAYAQAQAKQPSYPSAGGFSAPATTLQLPTTPERPPITPNGAVVEDVIARVNDQIITRSEYDRSAQQMLQEFQRQNAPQADLEEHVHTLLRDMIDQQLLLSKGKELGVTCDSEVVRQLDEIRKQYHLDSMEALEKAATAQGLSYEDFKKGIRNQCITQQVVRDEVGRRLNLTHAEEQTYYDAHAREFEVPEQLHLSEILVPTAEGASDADISAAQTKADALEVQLKGGANFAEVAKTSSGGPTASAGGDLGDFKRGSLGQVLEDATFSLAAGGFTAPIRTRQGFVILRVDGHQVAGVPPLSAVEPQIQQAIYVEQLQPALRTYLTKARDSAYVEIAPGFTDAGSPRKSTKPADIAFTAYTPPPVKKKVQAKQRAEQERAAKAQTDLAAARERLAEKQAAKVAASGGVKNASSKPVKQRKIRKEKIRYGQAPRNSLPTGVAQVADTSAPTAGVSGQAAGVAMAPTESVTSITTGTGVDADNGSDPLAPRTGPTKKSRFSSHEEVAEEERAKTKLAKAEVKATTRPVASTPVENVNEKVQAAPLGLNGDTTKKQKKAKRQKGEAKERLQDNKPKPTDTVPVAPTVNPTLNAPATTTPAKPDTTPSADQTTLPPASTNTPGAVTQGQPVPATTAPGIPK